MRRNRQIIGILLIVAAAVGIFFWETTGREAVLMDKIMVAATSIPAGTEVTPGLFCELYVPRSNLVEGALHSGNYKLIAGQKARRQIPAKAQILQSDFVAAGEEPQKGQSIFVLPAEWIAMESSSLRRGDRAAVYDAEGMKYLGSYRVAFVKAEDGTEISDDETGRVDPQPLERVNGSGVGANVEIIASLSEYKSIRERCQLNGPPRLLLIQEKGEAE